MKPHKEIDLDTLRKLIALVDGYRINRYTELKAVEKEVKNGKAGRKIAREWKGTRQILYKIANVPRTIPKVVRLAKIRTAINFFSFAYFSLAFILTMSHAFFGASLPTFSLSIYGVIMITAIISFIAGRFSDHFLNWKIAVEIDGYFKNHPKKFGILRLRLKAMVQGLIDALSRYIKLRNEDPNKYPIKLYNIDYKGISVARKPGRLVKYYTAVPTQTHRKNR